MSITEHNSEAGCRTVGADRQRYTGPRAGNRHATLSPMANARDHITAGTSGDRDEIRRWLAEELVSKRQAAEILGVDPRRVQQLEQQQREGKREDFPAPALELDGARAWFRAEIEEFAEGRSGRPGPVAGSGRAPLRITRPRALKGYSDEQLAAAVEDPRAGLSASEQALLRSRLGLYGEQKSQRQIADELDVSLQTVIFRQNRAIEKLLPLLQRPGAG